MYTLPYTGDYSDRSVIRPLREVRTVDDMLYVVQSSPNDVGSRAISIDISDPRDVKMVHQLELDAASKEIKVTPDVIFVAGSPRRRAPG